MYPRTRKAVKWGGTAVLAVLGFAWAGSLWRYVEWRDSFRCRLTLGDGALTIEWFPKAPDISPDSRWSTGDVEGPCVWWSTWRDHPTEPAVIVPLWYPMVPLLGVTYLAWRLDARARGRTRRGECVACGYSLAGLRLGAPCPECGRAGVLPQRAMAPIANDQ
jgi:hypothetical protein